jgi:hypothetical protein
MRRSFLVALVSAALAGSTLMAQAADSTDEMFRSAPEPGLGYIGYTAYPWSAAVGSTSGLLGMETSDEKVNSVGFCTSLSDPTCAKSDFIQFSAYYPICKAASDLDCIEAITATNLDGKELTVSNVTQFSDEVGKQYTGDAIVGLPSGASPTLFTVTEAKHSLGTQYMAAVTSYGHIDKSIRPQTVIENGSLAIFAIKTTEGKFSPNEMANSATAYAGKKWRTSTGGDYSCNYTDGSKCAIAGPMPTDVKFGLKVRYSTSLAGWFHGRVQDPTISYLSISDTSRVLTVTAQAVQVPAVSVWKKKTEIGPELRRIYNSLPKPLGGSGTGAGQTALQEGPESGWSLMRFNNTGYSEQEFEEFLAWLPLIGDKANLVPVVWTMNLMTNFNSGVLGNKCSTSNNELTGMVSTNSTQYLAGPPSFNSATGELEYKVAGPHLLPNGELSRGTYDLSLKADFARCLYGITGTAVRATVSILSESGTAINAVSVVNEKNGWLNFAARGFTYSSPTIKVKLTQVQDTVTPTPTPSAKPAAAKKTTITCVKGKTSKKVTAVKPKCPTGFKKKS